MEYLAAIDYEHLDNGVFLSALASSLSKQEGVKPLIIHGDSEYTERVIQTGVMREEAKLRSIKDLNHRLIALFADQGVSTIGINGYQREFITLEGGDLNIDRAYYESLPEGPAVLLSTLVYHKESGQPKPIELPRLARFLRRALDIEPMFIFSRSEKDEIIEDGNFFSEQSWGSLDSSFKEEKIPQEFHNFQRKLRLTTAQRFHEIPSLNSTMLIT